MKSLIKVLVVLWISQSVCCFSFKSKLEGLIKSNSLKHEDNEFIRAFNKIGENCDGSISALMIEKMKLLHKSDANTVEEKVEQQQLQCNNEEYKQKMLKTYDEVSTFFKSCIDPKYIKTVDKLHSAIIKMQNIRCDTTVFDYKEFLNMDEANLDCLVENSIQLSACMFSEQDILRMSKNTSLIVDFHVLLIEGNDHECGVVSRIEKCVQKALKTCKVFPKMIDFLVNTVTLGSFDCKLNETVEISQELAPEPLRISDIVSIKDKLTNSIQNCNEHRFKNKMQTFMGQLVEPIMNDQSRTDPKIKIYNSVCDLPQQKLAVFQFIDEIAEDVKGCIDTKHVEYVDKIVKPIKRAIDIKCETMDQDMSLMINFSMMDENLQCFTEKAFTISGCLYSSEFVKEIVNDSSKLSSFAMNLLGGEEKECASITEFQKCVLLTLDTCKDNSASSIFKYVSELLIKSMACETNFI